MKRIALLGLIGFILTGCGDDKVTKEYLVGKWDCKLEDFIANNVNGKSSDYKKDGSYFYVDEYKIEEGKLYSRKNSADWIESDIINRYSGQTLVNKDETGSLKITALISPKSENQFFITEEYIFMKNDENKNEYLDFKTKSEGFCTRIK